MTNVPMVNTMAGMIKTDMDVSTIASLATQFRGMNVDTDVMAGMEPTTSQYKNDTWYEIYQTSAWRKMMSRVDRGLSPYESNADDPARGVSAQDSGAAATGPGRWRWTLPRRWVAVSCPRRMTATTGRTCR